MVSTTRFAQCLLVPVLPTSRRTASLPLSQHRGLVVIRSLLTNSVSTSTSARLLPADDDEVRNTGDGRQFGRSPRHRPRTRRRPRTGDFPPSPFHRVPRSSFFSFDLLRRRSIASHGASSSRMISPSASEEDDDGTPSSRRRPPAARASMEHTEEGEETPNRDEGKKTTTKKVMAAIDIDPDVTYVLRFDGGSRGNRPGAVAGALMVLYDGRTGGEVWSGRRFLGAAGATNNEAEYVGLVTGLRCALALGVRNVVAQGDSQLVVRQVDGTYRCKKANLRPLYEEAMDLGARFDSFRVDHIPREENARADELANIAMDESKSVGLDVLNMSSGNEEASVPHPEATGGIPMEGANVSSRDPSEESMLGSESNMPTEIDPGNTYVLLFCGRSHGTPATAGGGAVLVDHTTGREVWTGGRFLGSAATHHEAAYEGLLAGLRHARNIGIESIAVRSNFDLVVKQLEGTYRCRDAKLQPLYDEAMKLIGGDFASVQISLVRKDENLRAVSLAKDAIDRKESFGV